MHVWSTVIKEKLVIKKTKFLIERNIVISQTTPYNPQGNSLCEHYNRIIWKTIQLLAINHKHPLTNWEELLPEALYTIRTIEYKYQCNTP